MYAQTVPWHPWRFPNPLGAPPSTAPAAASPQIQRASFGEVDEE